MKKINSLPVLLKNPKILLIGGGKTASQKAKVLTDNGIDFFVISNSISDELKKLGVKYFLKEFDKKDAFNYNIIINATGNKEVTSLLKALKYERFIFLNIVDDPEECDFYFSSLLQYGNLKIAVSSDGASPTLTKIVKEKIKSCLPGNLKELSKQKLLERSNGIIDVAETIKETNKLFGKVYLIGCGPGDPELLTIKAYNIIRSVDVVLYDNLISEELLEIIPDQIDKIFVGKSKNNHSIHQDSINKLVCDYAQNGYKVARLKSGDPFIFGRGAEEIEFLVNHNVEVEVIAGISSAFAAPLNAGIPPTARGYSSGVSVVTAHLRENSFNTGWIDFLKIENHTTIVLMGLTQIDKILAQAYEKGVRRNLPVAIISNATRENQKVLCSTLENLAQIAEYAERPAVLVFGNVVKFKEIFSRQSNFLKEELCA